MVSHLSGFGTPRSREAIVSIYLHLFPAEMGACLETGSFDLEIKQRDFDRRRMFTDALQEKEGIHGWFASAEDGSIYMDEFDSTVADAAFDSLL